MSWAVAITASPTQRRSTPPLEVAAALGLSRVSVATLSSH